MVNTEQGGPAFPYFGKRLVIVPDGWPCRFDACPPGLFVIDGRVCFKSEYGQDAFNEAGEMFWGGTGAHQERAALIVQPCITEWVQDDE